MKVVVLQSNYLPWKGYFDLIQDADVFVFYDEVKYTKNDWRNRNKICSKNGLQWLTIPVHKHAVKQKISEVRLENKDWQQLHFDTLYFAYKRAPHFHQLEFFLHDFYKEKTWEFLSELNQYTIKKLSTYLGITTTFRNSDEFNLRDQKIERLIGVLEQAKATHYISGPSAREYLLGVEHLFMEKKIELQYKDYNNYPPYQQLSSPFNDYVSIIDLIANVHQDDIANHIWAWRNKKN